jgi:putative hydroxymethylpyrimidine transport system ATP-binding protein
MISGVLEPTDGEIKLNNCSNRLGKIAYMQQKDLLLPWLTVKENVMLPYKINKNNVTNNINDILEKAKILGIEEYLEFFPHELSGGLKQRVSLLRTILQNSEFILLDEPFASLDAITRLELYSWIEKINKHINKSIILVTHDIEEAIFLSDHVIIMSSGKNNFRYELPINLKHPRNSNITITNEFFNLKKLLLKNLRLVRSID